MSISNNGYYTTSPYGSSGYVSAPTTQYIAFPTPETKDQFIRRFVMEKYGISPLSSLVEDAKLIWAQSVETI